MGEIDDAMQDVKDEIESCPNIQNKICNEKTCDYYKICLIVFRNKIPKGE